MKKKVNNCIEKGDLCEVMLLNNSFYQVAIDIFKKSRGKNSITESFVDEEEYLDFVEDYSVFFREKFKAFKSDELEDFLGFASILNP